MASIAAFVYFWSSAYEVSGGCATDTLYPSFLRMLATASQPEPSAKAPCTRTTFLICCFTTILLCRKDPLGPIDVPMIVRNGVRDNYANAGFCCHPFAVAADPPFGGYGYKQDLTECC